MAFNMAYLKRLGLHGGRLAWRVLMILASVAAYSLWEMIKHPPVALNQDSEETNHWWEEGRHGYYSDGTPWPENNTDPAFPDKDVIYYGNSTVHLD
mgnify:CR=1 FL=1